jgi:hypothetical protein
MVLLLENSSPGISDLRLMSSIAPSIALVGCPPYDWLTMTCWFSDAILLPFSLTFDGLLQRIYGSS